MVGLNAIIELEQISILPNSKEVK